MILEFPIYINKEITLQLENYKKHHVCRLYAQDFTETLQFALCQPFIMWSYSGVYTPKMLVISTQIWIKYWQTQ